MIRLKKTSNNNGFSLCIKTTEILIIIFSILFFIFPLSYGLTKIKYILVILIFLYISIKYIFSKTFFQKININSKYYPVILFCITIISRVVISLLLYSRILQVSDFGKAFNVMSSLNFNDIYYQNFVHWIFYPGIYNFILKFFTINQLTVFFLNSIVLSFVSLLIYKLAVIVIKNKKHAFVASLLYIFWPANALYVGIMTPEHVGKMFLLLGVIFALKIIQDFKTNNKFKFFGYSLLAGMFLAISVFFKNFAPVVLIAIFIYLIFLILRSVSKKDLLIKVIVIFCNILVAFFFTKNIMYFAADNIVGTKVNRNIAPCYLLVGLHSSSDGRYNSELYNTYFNILAQNNDYNKTNNQVKNILLKDIKNNDNLAKHLYNKSKILMFNDSDRIYSLIISANENKNYGLASFLTKYIEPLNNLYYRIILVLMFFGLLKMNIKKNLEVLLLYIIIFGACFLIILIEVQSRYLYALLPFFCIIASYGLDYIKTKIYRLEEK